ncbi:glutathione-dependent disulfide-bond oxidoreductase [Colwellia sp. MEBiC06753]
MSDKSNQSAYEPPKKWIWDSESGGKFANINRPISGATHDKELPVGKHPLQLYSLATPNGVKVTIMLEELLAAGFSGAEYDAFIIDIMQGDQFSSGFVGVNPNSKIPALVDQSDVNNPIPVFESGAILLYLAEKFATFMPVEAKMRAKCFSWLMWQMGSAPYLGGGFGHFYAYAPEKFEYPINRFTMEIKRQLDVLDKHLAEHKYLCGEEYTIADMAIWPWYGELVLGALYNAAEFLDVSSYQHLTSWARKIAKRPAVKRGRMVNRAWGELNEQLHERHDASDFELKTQDKLSNVD